MTVGIAIKLKGKVLIGIDSRISCVEQGFIFTHHHEPKLIDLEEFVLGFAGSSRYHNIIKTLPKRLDIPTHKFPTEMEKLYTYFPEHIRSHFYKNGIDLRKEEAEFELFVVHKPTKRLFHFLSSLTMIEQDVVAIGNGAHFALGAFFILEKTQQTQLDSTTVRKCLLAAKEYCNDVEEPFIIQTV